MEERAALIAAVERGDVQRAEDGNWSWDGRIVTRRVKQLRRRGLLTLDADGRLRAVTDPMVVYPGRSAYGHRLPEAATPESVATCEECGLPFLAAPTRGGDNVYLEWEKLRPFLPAHRRAAAGRQFSLDLDAYARCLARAEEEIFHY